MDFVLIDYSLLYYKTIMKKPVPGKRGGKFVQLRDSGTEYLALSLRELSFYHANIVERFFRERGLPGQYNGKRDHYRISGQQWDIAGGGMWSINVPEKLLCLSGRSQAYGRFDSDGLGERIAALLAGYRVEII